LLETRPLRQAVQVASPVSQMSEATPHVVAHRIQGIFPLDRSSYSTALDAARCKPSIVEYSHGLRVKFSTNDMSRTR
jgi:hypothetical protein